MKTIYRIFKSVGLALIALWMVSCQDLLTEDPKGQLAVTNFFNSKGVYDKKKTVMYRNAAKIDSNATQIKKLLGKYKKVSVTGESCFGNGNGSDVVYVYDNIELSVFRPTGKDANAEIVESVSQRY